MKKILTALVTIMTALAFSGCADAPIADGGNTEIGQGYSICYAFTASSDVTEINDKTVMKDYMDALGGDGLLEFDGYDGDFGFYITSVYGITSIVVASTPNSYTGYDWAVYTTLTELDGAPYTSDDAFIYGGVTLYKSSYGVSGLPCVEGHTYALVYELSSMSW